NGMIEEVKSLLDSSISYERIKLFGLEYKFIAMYLKDKLNYNDMYQKLNSAINNFAKRQMTWFRKMEKEGCVINWIEGSDYTKAQELIKRNYFNE
ncbi:MAG: tRNA (adenosine(37)-N6)-dimethylallyltransferase MiaA, partial [Bacteroidetes bacterium]|nr:tRNA (adenosine(37)-N6)-dimethylallyltransferase MiaA [Bacteroidota bacterium]